MALWSHSPPSITRGQSEYSYRQTNCRAKVTNRSMHRLFDFSASLNVENGIRIVVLFAGCWSRATLVSSLQCISRKRKEQNSENIFLVCLSHSRQRWWKVFSPICRSTQRHTDRNCIFRERTERIYRRRRRRRRLRRYFYNHRRHSASEQRITEDSSQKEISTMSLTSKKVRRMEREAILRGKVSFH